MSDALLMRLKKAGISPCNDLGDINVGDIAVILSSEVKRRLISSNFDYHIFMSILWEAAQAGPEGASEKVISLMDDRAYITKLIASRPK